MSRPISRSRRAFAAAALAASTLTALVAFAEGERTRISLEWTVEPEATCAGREIVVREVAAELGYDPFGSSPTLALTGRVWRDGDRYRGAIRRVGGTGEKVEASTDCRELARLLAFDIALLVGNPVSEVDAGVTDAAPPPPPPDASAPDAALGLPPPPPVSTSTPPPPPPPPVEESTPFQLRFGASALAVWSPAERLQLGLAGEVGVRWPSVSLGLEGRAILPASVDGVAGTPMDASLLLATAYPCLHRGVVLLCAALAGGTLTLVRDGAERSSLYAGAGARAGVELALGRGFSAAFRGDVLFGLRPVVCSDAKEDGVCDVPTASTWTGSALSGAVGAALLADF